MATASWTSPARLYAAASGSTTTVLPLSRRSDDDRHDHLAADGALESSRNRVRGRGPALSAVTDGGVTVRRMSGTTSSPGPSRSSPGPTWRFRRGRPVRLRPGPEQRRPCASRGHNIGTNRARERSWSLGGSAAGRWTVTFDISPARRDAHGALAPDVHGSPCPDLHLKTARGATSATRLCLGNTCKFSVNALPRRLALPRATIPACGP